MTFFQELCLSKQVILNAIYNHKFNKKLYDGTLSPAIFKVFLEQDELYLRDFAQALKDISNRLEHESHILQLKQLSEETVAFERLLHTNYLAFFQPIQKSTVTTNYTRHLLKTARTATTIEAIASVLPCFYIYCELGKQMSSPILSVTNHPYRDWIASYTDEAFSESTNRLIATFEELTNDIHCPIQKAKIMAAFSTSVDFELEFFNGSYSLEISEQNLKTIALH